MTLSNIIPQICDFIDQSHKFGTFGSHKFVTHLRTGRIEVKQLEMTRKDYLNSNLCQEFSFVKISAENSHKLQMSNFENRLASMLQIRKGTFISEHVLPGSQKMRESLTYGANTGVVLHTLQLEQRQV